MLHTFSISGFPVHVHLTEAEAMQDPCMPTAFIISLEDIYSGIHCDLLVDCHTCPIQTLCDANTDFLPEAVIRLFAPHVIAEYPEYFI